MWLKDSNPPSGGSRQGRERKRSMERHAGAGSKTPPGFKIAFFVFVLWLLWFFPIIDLPFFEVIVQDWSSLKITSENTATNIPSGDIVIFFIKRFIIGDWDVLGLFTPLKWVFCPPGHLDKQIMSFIYMHKTHYLLVLMGKKVTRACNCKPIFRHSLCNVCQHIMEGQFMQVFSQTLGLQMKCCKWPQVADVRTWIEERFFSQNCVIYCWYRRFCIRGCPYIT